MSYLVQPSRDGLYDRFFHDPVAQTDPEVAAAIADELAREQDHIELIASENIVSRAVLEAQGSVMTNKYAEGLPGRRYYGGCEYVDVAEELAIEAGRDPARHVARRRRPSHSRRRSVDLRQVAQRRTVRRQARRRADRLRRGGAPRHGASAEDHRRRRLGLSADHRLRPLPDDCRSRRFLFHGRHGALRRAGGRGDLSEPVPACPRGDDDDAQDAARAARRHDPQPGPGAGQEVQRRGVPRPAGRPADARHRCQGGGLRRGAAPGVQGLRRNCGGERQGSRRHPEGPRPRHRLRRHRLAPDAGRPAAEGADRQGGRGEPRAGAADLQQERHPV